MLKRVSFGQTLKSMLATGAFFNLRENFLSSKCHYVLLDAFSRKAGIRNPVSKQNMKPFEWLNSQVIIFFLIISLGGF